MRNYVLVRGYYSNVRNVIASAGTKQYRVHATWKPIAEPCQCKWCKGGAMK